ncbi:MAG: hypothetical protein ABSE84_16005, partial [Isosphaeraceae bacterium]
MNHRLPPTRSKPLATLWARGEDEKSQALSITIVELYSLAKECKAVFIETTVRNARRMSAEQSERMMQDPCLTAPGT